MSIIAFVDQSFGTDHQQNIRMLSYAIEAARRSGTESIALVVGNTDDAALQSFSVKGLKKIYYLAEKGITAINAEACIGALFELIRIEGSRTVVMSNERYSTELAAKLSVKFDAALVLNAVSEPGHEIGSQIRTLRAGIGSTVFMKILADRKVITVNDDRPDAKLAHAPVPLQVLSFEYKHKVSFSFNGQDGYRTLNLRSAKTVVAGGLGLQTNEDWQLLEIFSKELKAAIGCTKPVADAGIRPPGESIGQEGVHLTATFYIAIGLSGAVHHLEGVKNVKKVLAINSDSNAPIFQAADLRKV